MVLNAFQQRKEVVLAGLQADCGDKSRKGSVDAPVAALVGRINAHPAVYTTSSCSGRITVFGEPTPESRASGKKGGEWAFASHDPADPDAVVAAVHAGCGSGARLVLRFEPFILHLEADTAATGQRVLAAARAAGYRESGLTLGSGGKRVMVAVRCSLRMEAPVADAGAVLVPDSYIRYLVALANDKFVANLERINRFERELASALQAMGDGGPVAASNGGGGDSHAVRRAGDGMGSPGPPSRPAAAVPSSSAASAAAAAGGALLRRRRAPPVDASAGSIGGARAASAASPLEALRQRQAQVLARIAALEERLLGTCAPHAAAAAHTTSAAPAVPGLERGGGGHTAGTRSAGALAGDARVAPRAGGSGGPLLRWQPIAIAADAQLADAVLRWGHASATCGHRILLLGGYGGGGAHARRGDVLSYDTRRRAWEVVAPRDPAAPAPSARMGHAACCLAGRYVVLVGGRTSPVDALDDVWILDVSSRAWIQARPELDPVTTAGAPCVHASFPGRYRHTVVAAPPAGGHGGSSSAGGGGDAGEVDGWRVLVYGGRNADAVLGDAWALYRDATASGSAGGGGSSGLGEGWRWRQVAAAGAAAPSPRKSHAACFVPASACNAASSSGRLYVHGGTCSYGMHAGDTWYLDADSYTWHPVAADSPGGGAPACFSHTLNRWGPYLLLVGGYPTDHHRLLYVLDARAPGAGGSGSGWRAVETGLEDVAAGDGGAAPSAQQEGAQAPPQQPQPQPEFEFLPIRHCAEVVAASGDGGDALYVMGGGAFCFSFGTLFGGCFRLPLGGPLLAALAPSAPAHGQAQPRKPSNRSQPRNTNDGVSASADVLDAPSSSGGGWAVRVPAALAKRVKDGLKARGWLDASRRGGAEAAAADAGEGGERWVVLPLAEAPPAAEGGDSSDGGSWASHAELRELLSESGGGQAVRVALPRASKQSLSPAQRLHDAVAELLRQRLQGARSDLGAPAGPSAYPAAHPAAAAAATAAATVAAGSGLASALAAAGVATTAARAVANSALIAELLAELPTKWERLGDLALLPAGCMTHAAWARVIAGGGGGAGGAGPAGCSGAEDPLLPLWRIVAEALGVQRLARQAPVANTGTRDSRAVLLLGSDGWVAHREGGVLFRLDVCRCMFSSGNVTERTRMGWGRGLVPARPAPGGSGSSSSSSKAAKREGGAGRAGGGGGGESVGVAHAASPVRPDGGRAGWAVGETVVDLYCGVGYYTIPLLVVGGVAKVHACEWNPHALEALRRNLQQPPLGGGAPVGARCEVLPGDCRATAPAGVADRVLLGLLPSSRGGWGAAVRALRPEGGWLHVHHNVTDAEEAAWVAAAAGELAGELAAAGRPGWAVRVHHVERVKWYAPHVRHIVLDVECRPPALPRVPLALAPAPQPPAPVPQRAAAAASAGAAAAAAAAASSPAAAPPAAPAAAGAAAAGGRWYEQPLERLQRVRGVPSRADFERDISAARLPVVLEGMDIGAAPQRWTAEYLASLPGARTTLVSVHVTREPSGCLDFVHKNFAFRTMPLEELVLRLQGAPPPPPPPATAGGGGAGGGAKGDAAGAGGGTAAAAWPELVPRGPPYGEGREMLYLRSIGENPRKEPADLAASFPALAADLVLPPLFPPDALHSTVLRISSPGLQLWTHYDVMDNFLVQARGTKRVLLWPPLCHDALHVSGSSSPVVHLCAPDLQAYPRYRDCPAPLLAELAPGDVLFLPSLWFHHVTTTGTELSVSVNAFYRHLPPECYHRKDLYANRDIVQAEEADAAAEQALASLAAMPPHYRAFYGTRLLRRMERALGSG